MFDDGSANDFEHAHQKGLTRGFDLGWSYKGRFDRQIIQDMIVEKKQMPRGSYAIKVLQDVLKRLNEHECNREFVTYG